MSSLQQPLTSQQLPDWMRRAQRGLDWGFLLVLALCIIVSAPFLFRSELSHNNANENYVYRTNDYAMSIEEGWLYPRWSSHALGGYGAPIPSFYPPAPAYAAAILQILFTNYAVSAVRLLYVLLTCMAGISVYMLVMRHSGATSGILAAMLYIYSPFVSLIVPHVQGDLTTMLALALAPALLWATSRLISAHQPQNFSLVSLFTAGLFLTSIKAAVVICLLAIIFAVWEFRQKPKKRKFIQFLAAIGLGVLLSGFYWIPAWLEQSAIHWRPNIASEVHTLRLSDMIAPFRAIDTAEMTPRPQFTLGIIALLFVFGGGLTNIIVMRQFTFGLFFLISGLVVAMVGLLVVPHETWMLGVVILCLSVVGSDVLLLRKYLSVRLRRLLLPILMVGIWIGSTAIWLPPPALQPFGSANGEAQINYEQQGYGVAVLTAGEDIPSTLPNNVSVNRNLIDNYKSGGLINKLAPSQVTVNFQASPLSHFTHGDQFQLRQVSSAVTLNFLTAYFPGWRASVNGQRVKLQPNADTGLIQVDLPVLTSRTSELLIALGSTDVRLGSWIVSGLTLFMIVVMTWGKFRTLRKNPLEDLDLLKQAEARLIALPVGCFALVALLILIPNPLFRITQQGSSDISNSFETQMRSTTGLTLSAFKLRQNVYSPSDDFEITLFWQTQRFLTQNYQVKIVLQNNSDGNRWNETALRNPGYYPTRRWNTTQYIGDAYEFSLAKNIPAGNYQIHVQVYDCSNRCDENNRLNFFNPDGRVLGTDVILPTLISVVP
ncbi:MAG: hypothetical protein GC179_15230 [Anaerolineaceae bacterium]|nr:hypothetical protein [Anaerolineaceae bacterium]